MIAKRRSPHGSTITQRECVDDSIGADAVEMVTDSTMRKLVFMCARGMLVGQSINSLINHHSDPCTLPKVGGPCLAHHDRFYYDVTTSTCKPFVYHGCLGNSNRFADIEQCQETCNAIVEENTMSDQGVKEITEEKIEEIVETKEEPTTTTTMAPVKVVPGRSTRLLYRLPYPGTIIRPSLCALSPSPGPCLASIPFFHFDGIDCQPFVYGGCGGNDNRFETIEQCQQVCLVERQQVGGMTLIST